MMQLGIGLYESPGGAMLFDLAARGRGHRFGSGAHGFDTYTGFLPLSTADAFRLYDRPGTPYVSVTWYGVVWEGRLEDVAIVDGGVNLTALGYWRALSDVPRSELWSTTRVDEWFVTDERNNTNRSPHMYEQDNNNRLFVGLKKNAVYGNGANVGGWHYVLTPAGSNRLIQTFSCDYEILLPANWTCTFNRGTIASDDVAGLFSAGATMATVTGTGILQTGSQALTLASAQNGVNIALTNATGANYTMAGESGAFYAKITNIRIKTTTSAAVYADEIADALVAFVSGINSSQLSTSTALISSPTVDLTDEVYEDAYPADTLDRLARLGDNSTPVKLFETGVWERRVLSYQRRGATARTWYVDASSLTVERTLETLRNSAYGVYQDESGRNRRTAVSADAGSVARYGVTRRRAVDVYTTSSTQAGTHRDAALQDGKDPSPRAGLVFRELYDANGVRWPLFAARAWDTLVIRNLPPSLSVDIDRIRTFRVSATEYDVDADLLTVTPETPLPRLENLVLRERKGV